MPHKTVRYTTGVDPYILLMGCRPWVREYEHPKGHCPICHESPPRETDRLEICARCHSASRPMARLIVSREVGAPESGRRQTAEQAEVRIKASLARRYPVLDEQARRRIWNGYSGVFDRSISEPTNLARIGRDWLRSIDQEPHWTEADHAESTAS